MSVLTEVTCAHCTLPVPRGLIRDGDEAQFCCAGCRAVYSQIHACGLSDYYRFRDAGNLTPEAATVASTDAEAFDSEPYAQLYVRRDGELCSTEFVLGGVTCAACVWLVERLPSRLPGLIDARLSLTDSTLRLSWDPSRLNLSRIAAELMRFGYRPHPARGVTQADLYRRELRSRLVDLGVAGAITGNLMLLGAALYAGWIGGIERPYEQLLRWLSLGLGLLTLAWPGRTFFRGAWTAIRLRTVNFDLPIAIALATGGIAGVVNVVRGHGEIYFDSLGALIFLLLVGRLLQYSQQRRARGAVELLFSLTPSSCRVVDESGSLRTIPIQALGPMQTVEVRADELFPADGTIIDGTSTVDTSLLTGETTPVAVATGDAVFGGARNAEATLRVRVTATGEASRVGRLMQLLDRGLSQKPPIVQITDRVAARFTLVVTLAAIVTLAAWWWHAGFSTSIGVVVALLIVTCPCVLGLAVPLTFALSIGRLARRGVLVKSAAALERVARGGRLILDKTGTLTLGQMGVVAWSGDPQWQGVVAAIERDSTHPVGRALQAAYADHEPAADLRLRPGSVRASHGGLTATTLNGREIAVGSPTMIATIGASRSPAIEQAARTYEADGNTLVMVAVDGVVEAVIALADVVRPEAVSTLARLTSLGFTPEIASGDAQGVVDRVAASLGIAPERARGVMSPESKLALIRDAHAIMIGDGVNDAAALAAADVGIAVAGGAEAALAAADVYVARRGLDGIVELVATARHTLRIVRRNVAIATSYNVLAGVLAVSGLMHPLMAAVLMPMSSATVLSLTIAAARHGPKGVR